MNRTNLIAELVTMMARSVLRDVREWKASAERDPNEIYQIVETAHDSIWKIRAPRATKHIYSRGRLRRPMPGDGRSLLEVAAEHGVSSSRLSERLRKGEELDVAATTPARRALARVLDDGRLALDVARENGISAKLFYRRLAVGWTVERAATEPTRACFKRRMSDGRTAADVARGNGINNPSTFRRRLAIGWTVERAATEPTRAHIKHRMSDGRMAADVANRKLSKSTIWRWRDAVYGAFPTRWVVSAIDQTPRHFPIA